MFYDLLSHSCGCVLWVSVCNLLIEEFAKSYKGMPVFVVLQPPVHDEHHVSQWISGGTYFCLRSRQDRNQFSRLPPKISEHFISVLLIYLHREKFGLGYLFTNHVGGVPVKKWHEFFCQVLCGWLCACLGFRNLLTGF